MGDILITNALIVDGTGAEPFRGHLRIDGDRLGAVVPADDPDAAALVTGGAATVIDADGLAAAPGFIDCHSHFDWVQPLPDHPTFLHPMVEQGITTVVTGNCGFSPAPVPERSKTALHAFSEMLSERPLEFEWEDLGGFLDHLEAMDGLLFNHVQQVGHGTVHIAELGTIGGRPDPEAMGNMVDATGLALDQGASGLSLGLMYPPGLYSTRDELTVLARAAAERGRLLSVHNRALSRYSGAYPIVPYLGRPHNLRALEEVLDIGLDAGVKVQISHFIFVGRTSWGTAPRALEMIEEAAGRGLEVRFDVYPVFCGNSYLNVFLPAWFLQDLSANLKRRSARWRLRLELLMARRLLGFDLSDIWIMDAACPRWEGYNGRCLTDIARAEGADPISVMLEIVKDSDSKALQLTYGYSGDDEHEDLLETLLAHERCLFETDTVLKSRGKANPASYGAYPRILGRYVRDKGVLSLAEAVHKMTGATARWMDIRDRGELRAGSYADLVLFDPATIADTTTPEDTTSRPVGIDKVFCNGAQVVDGGRYLAGTRPGRVLRSESGGPRRA